MKHYAVFRLLMAGLAFFVLLVAGPMQAAHAGWVWDGADYSSAESHPYESHGGEYDYGRFVDAFHAKTFAEAGNGTPPTLPANGVQTSSVDTSSEVTHYWSYDGYDGASGPTNVGSFNVTSGWSIKGTAASDFGRASSEAKVYISGNEVASDSAYHYQYTYTAPHDSFDRTDTFYLTIARTWGSNTAQLSISSYSSAGGADGYAVDYVPQYKAEAKADIYVNTNPF